MRGAYFIGYWVCPIKRQLLDLIKIEKLAIIDNENAQKRWNVTYSN